jgi:hypothetical protein
VLHPNQFQVNEAWIAFKLNDEPLHTRQDGDFNFLALMDAASCFILSSVPVAAKAAEPTQKESKQLLQDGKSHRMKLPKVLFVPIEQPARFLVAEAERVGIEVVRIEEYQLMILIGEAREAFRENNYAFVARDLTTRLGWRRKRSAAAERRRWADILRSAGSYRRRYEF